MDTEDIGHAVAVPDGKSQKVKQKKKKKRKSGLGLALCLPAAKQAGKCDLAK